MSVIKEVKVSEDIQCKNGNFINIKANSFITEDSENYIVKINDETISFNSADDIILFKDMLVRTLFSIVHQ